MNPLKQTPFWANDNTPSTKIDATSEVLNLQIKLYLLYPSSEVLKQIR